jgi:glycerol-3-phosphate dehydrogenase
MEHYDAAIIGAGVSGASVARRLSMYNLSVVLLEREADVSFGVSKANSGIIHGGFHHNNRYLKARLEVQGAGMYPQLHRELGFPYKQCGIVVVAFTSEDLVTVEHLYRQGVENGSAGIELCGGDRIRDLEPKIHKDAIGGLYAPAGGIIEPYRFVFSLVENAEANGLHVEREFDVVSGTPSHHGYVIEARDGAKLWARYVVNAAGLYADEVSRKFGAEEYAIHPRRGEYHLLDRSTAACPDRVVFPVPTPVSKGMLVIPTVEGTVLLGPTADPIEDKSDVRTTAERLREIVSSAQRLIPAVSGADVITSFSGLRPTLDSDDFYITESELRPGFIHVAGIQSPGLTAAPAVGELVKDLLKTAGCKLTEKSQFISTGPPVVRTRLMDDAEIQRRWTKDANAGEIVCRCETVTRDEVVRAIHAGHVTVDGIKFFCRASAGRCQGAFCTPKILEIIAEETGAAVTEISKRGPGSELVTETLPGTPERAVAAVTASASASASANGAGTSSNGKFDRLKAWAASHTGRRSSSPARLVPPVRAQVKRGQRLTSAGAIDYGIVDSVVLGGGAAGMAAASELSRRGFKPLVIDRERSLGGILRQCVHNGFGIHEFGEELTGPEYAERYVDEVRSAGINVLTGTAVLGIKNGGSGMEVRTLSPTSGLANIRARTIVLAMGSRERNRGSIQIPGTRPAGVMTAGAAQRMINVDGFVPGHRAVVIGSGDIGLIMARRLKLIGAEVEGVVEIKPVPSGINRNIVQCLDDFGIPLYLGHVVTRIYGDRRVSGVDIAPLEGGVARVDRAFHVECDTVLLSVGLIPENELSRGLGVRLHGQTGGPAVDSRLMTSVPGVFAAGNVLHIHDLVDFVAEESRRAGQAAADYLDGIQSPPELELVAGSNVRYVMPGRVRLDAPNRLYLRSLISKNDALLEVRVNGKVVKKQKEQHVQPSEMVSVDLAEGALSGVDPSEPDIRVEVALL